MLIGLGGLLARCYSFDKNVALEEFKELKPDFEIVQLNDYACDGAEGECWYVEFIYKAKGSETLYDTTLQYWKRDGKWITRGEFNKQIN